MNEIDKPVARLSKKQERAHELPNSSHEKWNGTTACVDICVNEKTMSPTVFVCKITNVTGGRDGTMFIKLIQLVTQASRPGSGSSQSTSKLSRPGVCLSSHHSEDGDRQTVPG